MRTLGCRLSVLSKITTERHVYYSIKVEAQILPHLSSSCISLHCRNAKLESRPRSTEWPLPQPLFPLWRQIIALVVTYTCHDVLLPCESWLPGRGSFRNDLLFAQSSSMQSRSSGDFDNISGYIARCPGGRHLQPRKVHSCRICRMSRG
jgi:hypothetical protein